MTKLNHSANVSKAIKALDVVTGKTGQVAFAEAIRAIALADAWREEIEDLLSTVYANCEAEWSKLGDKRPTNPKSGKPLSAGQHPKFQACREMVRKYSNAALGDDKVILAKQSKDPKTNAVSFTATVGKKGATRGKNGASTTTNEPVTPKQAVDGAIGILTERVTDLAKNGKTDDARAVIDRVRNALDTALQNGRNLAKGAEPTTVEKAKARVAA